LRAELPSVFEQTKALKSLDGKPLYVDDRSRSRNSRRTAASNTDRRHPRRTSRRQTLWGCHQSDR
jgi:hypothetical protein